jgi:8-amino-7-oxononanoate synthase
VACAAALKEVLVQKCAGLIYATALPPLVLGAVRAALDLLPSLQSQREHLHALAQKTRTDLQRQGWNTGLSQSHIIPLMVGDNARCLSLRDVLAGKNIHVSSIRPPTVPPKTARLRISLRVDHNENDTNRLVAGIVPI